LDSNLKDKNSTPNDSKQKIQIPVSNIFIQYFQKAKESVIWQQLSAYERFLHRSPLHPAVFDHHRNLLATNMKNSISAHHSCEV